MSGCWFSCVRGILSAVALSVTVTANDQGVGVMSQTIEGSAGKQVVVEGLGPLLKGAITGNDQRACFVPVADDLVQVLGSLRGEGMQPKVIQDEQVGSQDPAQQAGVGAIGPGSVEIGQQSMGRARKDAILTLERLNGQPVRQVTFPNSRWSA